MIKEQANAQEMELRLIKTIEKLGNPTPGVAELAAMLVFLHAAKKKMPEDFSQAESLARRLLGDNKN